MIRVVHPGSGLFTHPGSQIPDPGVKKAPDPQHWLLDLNSDDIEHPLFYTTWHWIIHLWRHYTIVKVKSSMKSWKKFTPRMWRWGAGRGKVCRPSTCSKCPVGWATWNQCCGSGSEIRCLFDPWIRYPGWVNNQDPDPGSGPWMNILDP